MGELYLVIGAFLACSNLHAAEKASVNVTELITVLHQAEESSPRIKAYDYRVEASMHDIRVEKSSYWPQLDAAAIGGTGHPGAFSLMEVDNNYSSSQRLGLGGALIFKQSLYDFGRTAGAVRNAEATHEWTKRERVLVGLDVKREILKTYLDCAYLKSQVRDAATVAELARLLSRETNRFVQSGQRSIIERLLVDAEVGEAETRTAELSERVKVNEERLAILSGPELKKSLHCTDLSGIEKSLSAIEILSGKDTNPLLSAQQERVNLARARLDRARAESRPELLVMGTVGYFDGPRIQDQFNYAGGVGIRMPLFSGFKIEEHAEKEAAELSAEKANLIYSQQSIDAMNARYQEQMQSLHVRIDFLSKENRLAKQAFELARKRYLDLKGTMVDLRDTIRNMSRVLQSTNETYRDLYLARGEYALFN